MPAQYLGKRRHYRYNLNGEVDSDCYIYFTLNCVNLLKKRWYVKYLTNSR
jgi:hypothetical protein